MNKYPDRRVKPRISCYYPAILSGDGFDSIKNNDHAIVINLSASGLYLLTNCEMKNGLSIKTTVYMSNSLLDLDAPKISTNGFVIRINPQTNGVYGVAIKFNKYRFL